MPTSSSTRTSKIRSQVVQQLTDGLGADVAHGSSRNARRRSSWPSHCARPVVTSPTSGSTVEPATLHLEELWIKDVTITTGLVDTYSTPTLPAARSPGTTRRSRFVTHHFALDEFMEAYDVFARAAETGALKVVVGRG